MSLVVDASALVTLALSDEDASLAESAIPVLLSEGGIAPSLFWYELRSVLLVCERRGRAISPGIQEFLQDVERLSIKLDFETDDQRLFPLARQHQLSIYDTAYLELVLRTQSPLVSLDQALCRAVLAAGGKLFVPKP